MAAKRSSAYEACTRKWNIEISWNIKMAPIPVKKKSQNFDVEIGEGSESFVV